MTKIIEKHNRGVLNEGRNNGMAFAFLEKVKDGLFHTVQPASPCKDYLAEVVFTEKHGIPTRAYGLNYKAKLGIFSDVAYMAIKMMKTKQGAYNYSGSFEADVELLKNNYKEIERLVNKFEKTLKLKVLTTITPANDDYFLVTFSSEWCKSTYAISLFSLLLRVLMIATKGDKDIVSFLSAYTYNGGDKTLVSQTLHKVKAILEKKLLPPNTHNYSKSSMLKYMQTPHNNGIVSWNSSFDEVKLGV